MLSINNSLRSKLGTSDIYDPGTQIYINLPAELKIFNRKANTWLGGTEDGDLIVHVERLSKDTEEIPTILAEGDLDLYLFSKGPIEIIDAHTKGVHVNGTFSQVSIHGYLALGRIKEKATYLVLMATKTSGEANRLKEISLDIVERFIVA